MAARWARAANPESEEPVSSGQRHNLTDARQALELLAGWLEVKVAEVPTQGAVFAVGSMRRQSPTVGDLELLAPLADEQDDTLANRIGALFRERHIELWRAPGTVGRQLMGVRPGFAHCRVEMTTAHGPLPVEIFRYVPGEQGNMGWLALMKSGPVRFVRHALVLRGRKIGRQASVDAFPSDAEGNTMACAGERQALELCGLPWVPPEVRGEWFDAMEAAKQRNNTAVPPRRWRWRG
jgi:hypothetical protein